MNQTWVGWLLAAAFMLSLVAFLWLLSRPLTERERELDRRIKAKRTDMSLADLRGGNGE